LKTRLRRRLFKNLRLRPEPESSIRDFTVAMSMAALIVIPVWTLVWWLLP
jgi:hypothetical protein